MTDSGAQLMSGARETCNAEESSCCAIICEGVRLFFGTAAENEQPIRQSNGCEGTVVHLRDYPAV